MTDDAYRGLPTPPPPGVSALPPDTFEGGAVTVTGGGSGRGEATTAEFARPGASLVIVGREAGPPGRGV